MLEREPYIDAVIGPQSYHNFSKILLKLNEKKNKLNFTDFDVVEKFDQLNTIRNSDSKVSSFTYKFKKNTKIMWTKISY